MPSKVQIPEAASDETDVTDLILQDIQAGILSAGSWLKQVDLERRYKRDRNQIRRALDRLVQKRLVQHEPNRGYHVYQPDGRQAAEITEIRTILETSITGRIIENAIEADIEELSVLADTFERLVLEGTMFELYEINLSFHHKLTALAGNQELSTLISDIRQRTSSALASQWKTRARIETSAREHHQMVDAIRNKQPELLSSLIRDHVGQRY